MSVASTKAFYAQVAAGCAACGHRAEAQLDVDTEREAEPHRRPARDARGDGAPCSPASRPSPIAARGGAAPPATGRSSATARTRWRRRRFGSNCPSSATSRSPAATEDKKHIDLSSEPHVLVCVAGAVHRAGIDVIKEVAIFERTGNTPIVLCDEGTEQTWPTDLTVGLPLGTSRDDVDRRHGRRPSLRLSRRAPHRRGRRSAAGRASRLETAVDNGLELSAALPGEVLVPVIEVLEEADRGRLSGVLTSETALGRRAWSSSQPGRASARRRFGPGGAAGGPGPGGAGPRHR